MDDAELTLKRGDGQVPLSDIINVNELARHAPHLFEVLPISWNMHDVFLGVFMTYGNSNTWRDQVVQWYIEENFRIVPNNSCIDVLIQSSRRDVSDQRDHIYALLAHPLLQVNGKSIVRADYERHVDDVFLEASTKLVKYVDPTLALGVAGDMGMRKPRNLDDGKPTWVARWNLCLQTGNIGRPSKFHIPPSRWPSTLTQIADQWFHAGGKNITPNLKIEGKALTLHGTILDKVIWASEQIPATHCLIDDIIRDPDRHVAMEWVWDAIPSEPCRYTGKFGSRDAFTLTMVCGKHKVTGEAEDDINRHHRQARAYTDYIKSFFAGGSGDNRLRLDARTFEEDHAVTTRDRRFLVTEGGFYGLGPQLMQEGDVVAVVPGLNVPFVLRPTGEKYRLVGACYVHGVMRGEVFDPSNPLRIEVGEPGDIVIV